MFSFFLNTSNVVSHSRSQCLLDVSPCRLLSTQATHDHAFPPLCVLTFSFVFWLLFILIPLLHLSFCVAPLPLTHTPHDSLLKVPILPLFLFPQSFTTLFTLIHSRPYFHSAFIVVWYGPACFYPLASKTSFCSSIISDVRSGCEHSSHGRVRCDNCCLPRGP